MSKSLNIHPLIRRPLILFVSIMILSGVIVVISDSYLQHAYEGRQSEKRAMRIWKNKIDGSRESNKIFDEYESRYLLLVKNNVVGEENRLNWIEIIQATANSRNMPSVKYNLSSQILVEDKTGEHKAQGLEVYKSEMTLDMRMAHEGDLFAMLNTLKEKAQGLFVVEQCKIGKQGKSSAKTNENMRANCLLNWYTFKSSENNGG